jgi:hypothetical protein
MVAMLVVRSVNMNMQLGTLRIGASTARGCAVKTNWLTSAKLDES